MCALCKWPDPQPRPGSERPHPVAQFLLSFVFAILAAFAAVWVIGTLITHLSAWLSGRSCPISVLAGER